MPISAEQERILLNQYHLTSLYPTEWPHEHDVDSDEDEDSNVTLNNGHIRARSNVSINSRFQKMGRHASLQSSVASKQSKDAGVQKDEPDALGMAPSIATELRKRGLAVEENLSLRNRFMLSSTTFNPALYLSQVHQNASTTDLLRGLDFLSKSIEQKSASLKVLVESNFERFVRAKATIDSVYTEMRTQGVEQPVVSQMPGAASMRPHSRHTSKNQTHFRNTSGPWGSQSRNILQPDKKKTALTKESEYGVAGIKTPLQEVAIKAEEVWGPALGGREKEETLKGVMTALEQHRDIFRLSGTINESIKKNDYDGVIEAYKQARQHAEKAKRIAQIARDNNAHMGDADVNQIIVTARMWHDVSAQVEDYKHEIWKRLKTSHGRKPVVVADETDKEQHTELIGLLLQLGVDENPIWEWINSRYLYLKDKIARTFERSRIEVEIQRRKLTHNQKIDNQALVKHLRSASNMPGTLILNRRDTTRDMDTAPVILFWEKVQSAIAGLLSPSTGILGEVLEWWDTAQSFISNKAQKDFPVGVFAAGLEHLELDPDHVRNIRSGAVQLFNLIREAASTFFADPPVEDLSDLYSPVLATPSTPGSGRSPGGAMRSFNFDPNTVPPPSPNKDGQSEKFAFWAPGSNSLSSSHYLAQYLALVGNAAGEIASLDIMKQQNNAVENLKLLVALVRERCVSALCAAWLVDAERSRVLETWHRSPDRRDLTLMPMAFESWMERVLSNVQKMAYVADAKNVGEVVVPPPLKLLAAIRSTFVTGLYKGLSGMVENAEGKGRKDEKKDGEEAADGGAVIRKHGNAGSLTRGADEDMTGMGLLVEAVDGDDKNVRLLLTLSNFQHLRASIIPHLVTQFETLFSVKLTDESKTLRDVLSQIDTRLFNSYITPTAEKLQSIITAGITAPTWGSQVTSSRPKDVKPYVYTALLALVLVHSEVTSTIPLSATQSSSPANPPLISLILSKLLLTSSETLLATFRTRSNFTLNDLIQATLDVEFFSQTLNVYKTDAADTAQSNLYLAMDERTDHDARSALQAELPEMKVTLKRLKEGTRGEFGCFRRSGQVGRGRTATIGRGGN